MIKLAPASTEVFRWLALGVPTDPLDLSLDFAMEDKNNSGLLFPLASLICACSAKVFALLDFRFFCEFAETVKDL
jgi:hypothetical protein